MLSNVLLIEVPWHQGGWDGSICAAPEENNAYCLPHKQQSLVSFCQAMAGLPHLDRSGATESRIRQGLRAMAPKAKSPSLDCRTPPDPIFGRRHLPKAEWHSAATLSALPMLRPDPWCSHSLTTFKTMPSRHGLANLCTDDCFTLSGLDFQHLLNDFPDSWRNSTTDLGEDGNDRRLYCLVCCKDHPLPMGDENAVVVVGALRVRWLRNEGKLWQFKGESGYSLPLQELMRRYDEKRSDAEARKKMNELLDALPTVDHFPGRFGSITPKAAERLLSKMETSAEALHGLHLEPSPFSTEDAGAFVAQFKASPPFKYPNLGQVLQHVTGQEASLSRHMESYFKNEKEEDKLLAELQAEVNKRGDYTDPQKDFLKDYLIYYNIPAPYLKAALELFTENYSSHWGSYERIATEFACKVLNVSPYHLAMGVTLSETKGIEGEIGGKLSLDFRRIDEGERQRLGSAWRKDEQQIRLQALRYDRVLREEKKDDWAEVASEAGDDAHPFLETCDNGKVQRKTLHKARELVDAFFDNDRIVTPGGDDRYAIEGKRKEALEEAVKKGFDDFYKSKFPEAKKRGFDEFLKTAKGKQVAQAISEQSSGLVKILTNRFTIITGKAGAGKSEMFKKVVEELHQDETFLFMAPTGKAVQAIKEKIDGVIDDQNKQPVIPPGHYMTIQKFLVMAGATNELFEPATPGPNALEDEKLPLEKWPDNESLTGLVNKPVNIIIDEASMIDLEVMGNLCHTLQTLWGNDDKIRRFVFVGDINQLPPVQSGYPFRQLLTKFDAENNDSAGFGFQRLDVSLRFIMGETDNLTLTGYADSFCNGNGATAEIAFPENDGELTPVADNLFIGTFSDRRTLDACLDAVFSLELPFVEFKEDGEKNGYHAVSWKDGGNKKISAVLEGNLKKLEQLDKLFNGADEKEKEILAAKTSTYFLDLLQFIIPTKKDYFGVTQLTPRIRERYPKSKLVKYIQNRNDNEKKIYNGNLAAGVLGKDGTQLFYPDSRQKYKLKADVPESIIDEAYAITVHKSQGAGFSITVAILPESIHEGLRSPQMQYTAVTRTKDICILLKERLGDESGGKCGTN